MPLKEDDEKRRRAQERTSDEAVSVKMESPATVSNDAPARSSTDTPLRGEGNLRMSWRRKISSKKNRVEA